MRRKNTIINKYKKIKTATIKIKINKK